MDVPRRTGALLVYAGSVGLATTFLVSLYLNDVLAATRGWHCGYESCTVPATWTWERTRDVLLIWLGGLRSALQIRAGLHMQWEGFDRRGPLLAYFTVAGFDCLFLMYLGELPSWTIALAVCWPVFVYALTRVSSVRSLVWEPITLPRARLL
jgi:hypothetical protein